MSLFKSTQGLALGACAALLLAGSAAAQAHDGDWAGALKLPNGKQMRMVLHLVTAAGQTTAVLDSVDQDLSIPAAAYKADGDKASILFLAVGGELEGAFAPDNKTFTGAWRQGLSLPVTLTRQEPATPAPPAKP
jgi:hypothetical protein